MQENGFDVTGLDVSKEALQGVSDSIRAVVGIAEDMDFPDSCFDAAIYIASMQFIEDYRKAALETARVLRQDGKLVVMLLNPESEFFRQHAENPDSYVHKIKHKVVGPIEGVLSRHFIADGEYYLGIDGKKVFESNDPKSAGLYIITGVKRRK